MRVQKKIGLLNSPIGIWNLRRKLGCSCTTEIIEKEGSDYALCFVIIVLKQYGYVHTTRRHLILGVLDVVSMELWLSHEGLGTCFF